MTCLGDCTGNGEVTVDEVIVLVDIDLGTLPISDCEKGTQGSVDITTILKAVNNSLYGCFSNAPN